MDWSSKRVLVTGGAGFLGRYVCDVLTARGVREMVVPRSNRYDLVSGDAVRRLLAETKPQLVFHLAAKVGGIGANRDNPATYFYDNLMMGTQVLHESWRAGVEKVVSVATICAYPKHCSLPFREDSIWDGYPEETNAPYGLAKKMLSVQSAAYRQQHGLNSCVVYPVNLYGPGDNFDPASSHVIPAMLRKFRDASADKRKVVTLWGDGSPTREFYYVADCAEAVVRAAEHYDSSQPLNLGSGQEISIRALAKRIAQLTGFSGELHWDREQPNGQPRRRLDVSRAAAALGPIDLVDLDSGLRQTWEWFREQPLSPLGSG